MGDDVVELGGDPATLGGHGLAGPVLALGLEPAGALAQRPVEQTPVADGAADGDRRADEHRHEEGVGDRRVAAVEQRVGREARPRDRAGDHRDAQLAIGAEREEEEQIADEGGVGAVDDQAAEDVLEGDRHAGHDRRGGRRPAAVGDRHRDDGEPDDRRGR